MFPLIFIVGPTATGKSDIAFVIAKRINAEIVSCDSMLIYREPSIITAKPPKCILEEVKHHFVNIVSVKDTYNVFTYFTDATKVINDCITRNVPVVICGGTGLYFSILLDGIFMDRCYEPSLRELLLKDVMSRGKEYLYQKLREVDPISAQKISPNDIKRIIRALEVYYLEGIPIWEKQKQRKGLWNNYPMVIFGLTMQRKHLYQRINRRVDKMFEEGAVEEVKEILKIPLSITAKKIIGIEEIRGVLEGKYSVDFAKMLMSKRTCHFAKRQFTWFKRDKRIRWIDVEDMSIEAISKEILEEV
ncbi:MAG: tRNA (adenosine(37)-N6)-dimethylallyltransferase MiaA [Candidatus Omnitrophica bacterium]|nr:tRNA (adenosine(37)-N6)-dimethylallyltransferase MiaA [Candidatus Omnitrophota bacterium]MCM8826057.1 tRNA (adenosine(37)-N6)-dimethylallyltransferase MiaA [Candidatus Omnitrophota bacterium]